MLTSKTETRGNWVGWIIGVICALIIGIIANSDNFIFNALLGYVFASIGWSIGGLFSKTKEKS